MLATYVFIWKRAPLQCIVMDSIVQKEAHSRAGMLRSKHESLHQTSVPVSIVFEN